MSCFSTVFILNQQSVNILINLSHNNPANQMACCLSCCKYVAFFGILFYISLGFIILLQVQYLKFAPQNQTHSVIACFLTAIIELGIFLAIIYYEHRQNQASVQRPEYLNLREENQGRQRESSMKGIGLVDLSQIRQQKEEEKEQ